MSFIFGPDPNQTADGWLLYIPLEGVRRLFQYHLAQGKHKVGD
jgi:hypothetical protein